MPKHQQKVVIKNVEVKFAMRSKHLWLRYKDGDHVILNLHRESQGCIYSFT